jgi:hypothetical protein
MLQIILCCKYLGLNFNWLINLTVIGFRKTVLVIFFWDLLEIDRLVILVDVMQALFPVGETVFSFPVNHFLRPFDRDKPSMGMVAFIRPRVV